MDINAKEMTEAGEQLAAESMEKIKDKLSEGKERIKQAASSAKETAAEYAKHAQKVTREQIQKYPLRTLMITFGVGLALGVLVTASVASLRAD